MNTVFLMEAVFIKSAAFLAVRYEKYSESCNLMLLDGL